MTETPDVLIFSDLDGTLLDHHSYSAEPVKPLLQSLKQQAIPVIFCSSKTFAEMCHLRQELDNHNPFIVENGAAVFLPKQLFNKDLVDSKYPLIERESYIGISFCEPKSHWLACIASESSIDKSNYLGFSQMHLAELIAATGLDEASAKRAHQRDFGEPLQWLGDAQTKLSFIEIMRDKGATILEGGRFLHVCGATDKGRALQWLRDYYQKITGADTKPTTIAAGDGNNDIAMLEAADRALIIRSPVNAPPALKRKDNIWLSTAEGPTGWAATMPQILLSLNQDPKTNKTT